MNRTTSRCTVPLMITGAFALGPSAPHPLGDEVRCNYTARFHCDDLGCTEFPVGPAFLIVPDLPVLEAALIASRPVQVRRCNEKGCSPVDAAVMRTGAYISIAGPQVGYYLKVATVSLEAPELQPRTTHITRGDFFEVAMTHLQAYMGVGACQFPR